MKKLLFAISLFAAISCTSEDNIPTDGCEGTRAEINARYGAQIEWVAENTNPVDYRQIQLLNEERAEALENACD